MGGSALRAGALAAALLGALIGTVPHGAGAHGDATTATSPHGTSCIEAAEAASRRHGVPRGVLSAIALAESGTRRAGAFAPWPWTLNVDGRGLRFDTAGAARDHAREALRQGARAVDLGCFQINFQWHRAAFASLGAMLDPRESADYAARFLRRLFDESGDWLVAVGHYHSRTPGNAARYCARVEGLLPVAAAAIGEAAGGAGVPLARLDGAGAPRLPSVGAAPPGAGFRAGQQPAPRTARAATGPAANSSVDGPAGVAATPGMAGSLFAAAAWPSARPARAGLPGRRLPLIAATMRPLVGGGS